MWAYMEMVVCVKCLTCSAWASYFVEVLTICCRSCDIHYAGIVHGLYYKLLYFLAIIILLGNLS